MTIDLSAFTSVALERPALRCADFDTAAAIVLVWGTITQALFVLPRLAFVLAISRTPVYEGDGIWSWTFGADTNNIRLTAELLAGDSVEWTMRVTNTTLDNFEWYDGRCDFEATGGWWRFFDPALPVGYGAVLWSGWHKSATGTSSDLVLAIKDTARAEFGDSLTYSVAGTIAQGGIKDADGVRPGWWNITWDNVQYFGKIRYPEGVERCWNAARECCPCDSIPVE